MSEIQAAVTYNSNSIIYLDGSPSKYLYIVKRGEVRLMKRQRGHLFIFQICKPGDFLNDISVLSKTEVDHIAVTKTEVEIVKIEAKDVRDVLEKSPKWIPDIFKTLCERLIDSQEIIHEHNLEAGPIDPSYILSKNEEQYLLQLIEQKK